MIELKPGMRVRCVDAYATRLHEGREYTVESTMGDYVSVVGGARYWRYSRFKPVIRVKAGRSTAFSTTHVKSTACAGLETSRLTRMRAS